MEFTGPDEDLTPGELRLLLDRLDEVESVQEPPDSYATVSAVCEATGRSAEYVWDVLEEIRRADLTSRARLKILELEEPLYRVERPGHETRENVVQTYLARERTLQTILDRVDRPKLPAPKRDGGPSRSERASSAIALLILGFTVLLLVGTMGIAIVLASK